MNAPVGPNIVTPDDLSRFHIAEYSALMSKSIALVNLMFGVMTIGFAYLGIMINVWSGDKRTNAMLMEHLWGSLLPEQIIIIFWSALLYAENTIAIYIEKTLRPACVGKVPVGAATFWQYNMFVRDRHTIFKFVSVWMPPATSLGAFLGVVIFRFRVIGDISTFWLEYLAIFLGLALAVVSIAISYTLYKRLH
jgi:hypothetical protein